MELLPNLYWIEGRSSNIFLWRDEAGLLMVDTGMPGDAGKIQASLTEHGFTVEDVAAILITHADIDHAGTARDLSALCDAPIYAGTETARLLEAGRSPKHMPRIVQFLSDHFFGYKPVAGERMQIVEDGQRLPEFEDWVALATPGHCADHFSVYSARHGILFAGDALNTRGDRLQLSGKRITADRSQAAESARRLLKLTPAVFACGHGRPLVYHEAADIMMLSLQLEDPVI